LVQTDTNASQNIKQHTVLFVLTFLAFMQACMYSVRKKTPGERSSRLSWHDGWDKRTRVSWLGDHGRRHLFASINRLELARLNVGHYRHRSTAPRYVALARRDAAAAAAAAVAWIQSMTTGCKTQDTTFTWLRLPL